MPAAPGTATTAEAVCYCGEKVTLLTQAEAAELGVIQGHARGLRIIAPHCLMAGRIQCAGSYLLAYVGEGPGHDPRG